MPRGDDVSPLDSVRARTAQLLGERAADPLTPLPELRELEERLRLIDAGLKARPQPVRRRWAPTLWAMLVVGTLVSIAATVEVRSVPFSLELQARAATLRLDAPGELESQAVDTQLRLEGPTRLETPIGALTKEAGASGPSPVVLRAAQLTLRSVRYPADSRLILRSGPQVQLSLDAPQPGLAAEIEFAGNTSWRVGDAPASDPVVFEHAEWVRASAGDTKQPTHKPPPLDIWLDRAPTRTYTWSNLRPVALQFVERRAGETGGGEAVVASSLEQARISLPATGGEVKLGTGDRLEISGLVLEHFELKAGDVIAIKLSGTARMLATRIGDFERSLKPSLLEFIARHHTVSLLWSTALFLWGAIAWARRQVDIIAQ